MWVCLWTRAHTHTFKLILLRESGWAAFVALTAATAPSLWALRIRDFYDCCFGTCCYCCCCLQACFLLRSTFVRLLSVFVSCLFASASHLPHHRQYKYKSKHTATHCHTHKQTNIQIRFQFFYIFYFFCCVFACKCMYKCVGDNVCCWSSEKNEQRDESASGWRKKYCTLGC